MIAMFNHLAKRNHRNSTSGFTLLELLVVIGVVAVLIGFTLAAVRKVRQRTQGISCEANLHTLYTACIQYTNDYHGRFPFGFTFNRFNPNTGRPTDGGASGYIAWFSSFDKYLTNGTTEVIPLDFNTGFIDGATTRVFSSAFKCPAVPANFRQQIHYYQHGVVMPHVPLELGLTPPGRVKLQAPARLTQVNPDTALVWDTPVWSAAAPQTPSVFWGTDHTVSGYAAFCTFIDEPAASNGAVEESLLSHPEWPERRFRGKGGTDRFAQSTNPLKNPAGPIAWASDRLLASIGLDPPTANTDGVNGLYLPGNARFRHLDLGCNVMFADGSVRTLFLYPKRKVSNTLTGAAYYYDSDFRRYMLMIKWPGGGIEDSNTYPTE
jgi:prepilin-type N-terminal cleavage/methylation domain-containing protein/prepilin-type processing-associated H-X9-DG protein